MEQEKTKLRIKWGNDLFEAGITNIPNTFLDRYSYINITNIEAIFIIHLMKFYFRNQNRVYPKQKDIADKMNIQKREINRIIGSLRKKGLLITKPLYSHKNDIGALEYDFSPLLKEIEKWAKWDNEIKNKTRSKMAGDVKNDRTPDVKNDRTIIKKNNNKEETSYKDGLVAPTGVKRKDISFPKEQINKVIASYEELKGIKPQGPEYLPIQQAVKSMFMSGRSAEDIIACMVWFKDKAASGDKKYIWTENWTIQTIKMKIAEFLAGKLGDKESIPPEYAKFWK